MRKSRNIKICKKGFILLILFIYFICSQVISTSIRAENLWELDSDLVLPQGLEEDFHHGSTQTLPGSNVTIASFIKVRPSLSQSGLTVVSCKDCSHTNSKERRYFLEKPESSDCYGEYTVASEGNIILSLCTYKNVKPTTDALMWINLLHTSLDTSSSVLYQIIFWGSYKSNTKKAQKNLGDWRRLLSKIMILNDHMKVLPLEALQSSSETSSPESRSGMRF